jgi:hypothetical protein
MPQPLLRHKKSFKSRGRKKTNTNRERFSRSTTAAEKELKHLIKQVNPLKSRINRETDPVLKHQLEQRLRGLQETMAFFKRRLHEL